MSIKKELLKKKKMLLAYALVTSLSFPVLSGCGNSGFDYQEQDETIVVDGLITYDELKTLKLIHLTNEIAQLDKYVLVFERNIFDRYTGPETYYIDIETGRKVYTTKGDDFKNFELEIIVDHMLDYLYKYDILKDEYSIEDVEKLKEYLLNDETLNVDEEKTQEEAIVLNKRRYC